MEVLNKPVRKSWKEFTMRITLVIMIALALLFFIAGCAGGNGQTTVDPAGDGAGDVAAGAELDATALIASNCTSCHSDDQIYQNRNAERWPAIVRDMAARTSLNEAETEEIIKYLQENYSN